MKSESEESREKLIIDGNAFYEIDMECVRNKNRQKNRREEIPGGHSVGKEKRYRP